MRLIDADALRAEWLEAVGEYTANEILGSIDDIPTVPHEMSAREYGSTLLKICASHNGCCSECEINLPCAIPDRFNVPIVEKWAREHPEEAKDAD